MFRLQRALATILLIAFTSPLVRADEKRFDNLPLNTWLKLTPGDGTPPSPRLGYEGDCRWDPIRAKMIRYGGHNQGGGGEQGSEVWLFDPFTLQWELKLPNLSPPGVCCAQQNVFDPVAGRYVRFPAFSHSHGWQWLREIYLNDWSVWTYDPATNHWRNMRPVPSPRVSPLRCASWDSEHHVIVMFGGEGNSEGTRVYDPYTNTWTNMKPAKQPEFRSGGNMAYDEARKLHILFGAQFQNDPHTWAYDYNKNEWRDLKPAAMPPTDRNDAVLTYDAANKVVLALIKTQKSKEDDAPVEIQTWAFDAGANTWKQMTPEATPSSSGNRARQLMYVPGLNVAMLENCPGKPREQQVWVYRYDGGEVAAPAAPAKAIARAQPRVVDDLVVSVVAADRVALAWKPPAGGKDVVGYHIERAVVEVYSEDQIKGLKSRTPPLAEPSVGAIHQIGPFTQLTSKPVGETTFADASIDLRKPAKVEDDPLYTRTMSKEQFDPDGKPYRFAVYAYRVRAVNAAGAISGPSPATLTIPSPVQHVFSKEAGTTCQLKWAANSEQGIAGYRVYRLDGRYDKQPVSRLTAEPIQATTFSDETAGKSSRRYHVIAVDAIGQEGFPSSPVWFEREWKEAYKPFVGEWHQ